MCRSTNWSVSRWVHHALCLHQPCRTCQHRHMRMPSHMYLYLQHADYLLVPPHWSLYVVFRPHVYVHTHTHTYTHTHTHTHIHTHIHTYRDTYIHKYIHMYISIQACSKTLRMRCYYVCCPLDTYALICSIPTCCNTLIDSIGWVEWSPPSIPTCCKTLIDSIHSHPLPLHSLSLTTHTLLTLLSFFLPDVVNKLFSFFDEVVMDTDSL
jgi:hypothetical protein